jgi:formylglycine-generating enzyme required for sulfatase activity
MADKKNKISPGKPGIFRKTTDVFEKFKKTVPTKTQNVIIISIFLIIAVIFLPKMITDTQKTPIDKKSRRESSTPGKEKDEKSPKDDQGGGPQVPLTITTKPGSESGRKKPTKKITPDVPKDLGSDEKAYKTAESQDTIEAYENYLDKFPTGKYKTKAEKRLMELNAMPTEVYEVNRSSIAIVSKNKKDYWEAVYSRYGIKMVYIPAGRFKMGQTKEDMEWLITKVGKKAYNELYKDETPAHEVLLQGYWLGKTEVTNQQYIVFLNDLKSNQQKDTQGNPYIETNDEHRYSYIKRRKNKFYVEKRYANHPVIDVSWYGAKAYCKWLSKKTGFKFSLPTEAQWEKAARWSDGKKLSFIFPGGNREPTKKLANFKSEKTEPVDAYLDGESPYGLLNMAGNVWEWCSDRYNETYYSSSPGTNPTGSDFGMYYVRRGGGWNNPTHSLRCAVREKDLPFKCYSNVGFRICQE